MAKLWAEQPPYRLYSVDMEIMVNAPIRYKVNGTYVTQEDAHRMQAAMEEDPNACVRWVKEGKRMVPYYVPYAEARLEWNAS